MNSSFASHNGKKTTNNDICKEKDNVTIFMQKCHNFDQSCTTCLSERLVSIRIIQLL